MMFKTNYILFVEGETAGAGGSGESTTTAEETVVTPNGTELKALQEKVTALENNSKKILDEKRELEGKLKAIKDGELIKKGDLQKLLDEKTAELTATAEKLTKAESEAEEARVFKAEQRKELLDQLTDEHKEIAEDIQDITKLRKYVKANTVKSPANVDNGNASDKEIKLTDSQKKTAYEMFPIYPKEKAENEYKLVLAKKTKKD